MRHSSLMLDKTISHGTEQSLWDKSLSHMAQSSLMWDSPTRFVTSFKIILKLVEFFKIGWKSYKKYLGHSQRSTSFKTSFKIILKLVEFLQVVDSHKKYLEHSERSTSFVTVFKIILKLVEFFTSCGQSGKIFQTLRRVHKLCNFIQNNFEACRIFKNCRQS